MADHHRRPGLRRPRHGSRLGHRADRVVESGLGGGSVGQEAARGRGVRLRGGSLDHIADLEVFVRDEVVFAHEVEGGLVCVVETLAPDLTVQVGDLLNGPLVILGALVAAHPGKRDRARCAASRFAAARRPWRGLATCSPLEVVRKQAMPRSMPTTLPVLGSGSGWDCSAPRITYQRLPSRLTETVLTLPTTGRCWSTLTCPTPRKRTRVRGSCGVESQRQPSPSLGKSTVSNQFTPRKRG